MKGRLKDRIKLMLIIAASLVAAVLIVSIISGRISTQEIVVLADGEKFNINLPLDEQLDLFTVKEISKSDFKVFGESIVTDISQLQGKITNIPLQTGSPIPLSVLEEPNSGGFYSKKLEEGHTIRMIPQGAIGLPPIDKGDKINLGLTFQHENDQGEQEYVSSILFYDLEIANVVGSDIYVKLDYEQDVAFNNASKLGEFFVQLAGQKELPLCSELEEKEQLTMECLPDDFLPGEITQSQILQKLKNGEALNLSDRQRKALLEQLEERLSELKEENEKSVEESDDMESQDENNTTFEQDDITISLLEIRSELGGDGFEATNDGFLILSLQLENNREEPFIVTPSSEMELRDAEGNAYPVTFLLDESQEMFSGEVLPGETLEGDLVFDVSDSESFQLVFNHPSLSESLVWDFEASDVK